MPSMPFVSPNPDGHSEQHLLSGQIPFNLTFHYHARLHYSTRLVASNTAVFPSASKISCGANKHLPQWGQTTGTTLNQQRLRDMR